MGKFNGVLRLRTLAFLFLTPSVAACATQSAIDIVPTKLVDQAQIPGLVDVRVWGDRGGDTIAGLLRAEAKTLKAKYTRHANTNLLALSGGADDGAFGAGLLVGWGAKGDRPVFDLVTGISTGSLIAPFAFLGRDYDRMLATLFVKHGSEEIYQSNILGGLFGSSALADNRPLARLIEQYIDMRLLSRVADERARGHVLLIGTTNLNAQRPVYWDMGKIALARNQQALALFRKVLLASSALPGIFPPVEIEVTVNGKSYGELHVDGGPTQEVFISPADFSFKQIDQLVGRQIKRRMWVIRNGKITPEYAEVRMSAVAIAARSIETLTKNQGLGDLERIYDRAKADGIEFNLAAVPSDFTAPRPKPFDRGYMLALYQRGYEMGRRGDAWARSPAEARLGATAKPAATR